MNRSNDGDGDGNGDGMRNGNAEGTLDVAVDGVPWHLPQTTWTITLTKSRDIPLSICSLSTLP